MRYLLPFLRLGALPALALLTATGIRAQDPRPCFEWRPTLHSNEYSFHPPDSAASLACSRLWDFGDGQVSGEEAPRYRFREDGNHEVVLYTWDQSGRGKRCAVVVGTEPAPVSMNAP